jgi:8-oxo-dGTP diphosphatase
MPFIRPDMAYTYEYPRPAVTVDAVVFRMQIPAPEVLLIRRMNPPFQGMWALPGGFMDMNEAPEEAVIRELEEETGLSGISMVQFHTFGAVDRDPRHRTITVAYYGVIQNQNISVNGGDDASCAEWFPVDELPELAFDHKEIITIAKEFMKER